MLAFDFVWVGICYLVDVICGWLLVVSLCYCIWIDLALVFVGLFVLIWLFVCLVWFCFVGFVVIALKLNLIVL